MPEQTEQKDFYFYHEGPFTVRVFGFVEEVEEEAQKYLINNKYFDIDEDYAMDMNALPVEPTTYSSIMRTILNKETCLMTVNRERFNPKPPEEPQIAQTGINLDQLVFFDSNVFRVQKRRI